MARRYKKFAVTGVANDLALDTGLSSTENEPKKLIGVMLNVVDQAGNTIEGWIETNLILEAPDYLFDAQTAAGAADAYASTVKTQFLQIDEVMEVGKIFKIGIRCGATNKDLFGAYVYEITT